VFGPAKQIAGGFRMQSLSRLTRLTGITFAAFLIAATCAVTNGMAQDVTYGGQMSLNWTIDTYSCPAGDSVP
jgi:hypothetical protein